VQVIVVPGGVQDHFETQGELTKPLACVNVIVTPVAVDGPRFVTFTYTGYHAPAGGGDVTVGGRARLTPTSVGPTPCAAMTVVAAKRSDRSAQTRAMEAERGACVPA
jgi:hypothetical protein